jgi:uncharacterized membrane protein YhaH (DUF805 family)
MASSDKICSQCGQPILEPNGTFCGNCGTRRLPSEPNIGSIATAETAPSSTMISFVGAIQSGFRRYFDFRGRSTRAEFWWWILFTMIVVIGLSLADVSLGTYDQEKGGLLSGLFRLATLIPSVAVGARRLHDINRSGWWQLMWLIGWLIVPAVILIIWFCKKSDMQNDSMDA